METNALFYTFVEKGSAQDNNTNLSRCYYLVQQLMTDNIMTASLGIQPYTGVPAVLPEFQKSCVGMLKNCINMFSQYGAADCQLTKELVPPTYIWLLGLSSVVGIGRDNKYKNTDDLKHLMMDGYEANMRYIVTLQTILECKDIAEGCRWFFLDGPADRELSAIKCESYPKNKSKVLSVVYDKIDTAFGSKKFKKMFLQGENFA